jgi:hypothetical protein
MDTWLPILNRQLNVIITLTAQPLSGLCQTPLSLAFNGIFSNFLIRNNTASTLVCLERSGGTVQSDQRSRFKARHSDGWPAKISFLCKT